MSDPSINRRVPIGFVVLFDTVTRKVQFNSPGPSMRRVLEWLQKAADPAAMGIMD